MAIASLRELFACELAIAYDTERVLLQGMQEMCGMAQHAPVKQMFEHHISASRQQVRRLEQIFTDLGQQPCPTTCHNAEGLIRDFRAVSQQIQDPSLLDLAILSCWAKAEHCTIATYRGLVDKAQTLGLTGVAQTLRQVLSDQEEMVEAIEQAGRNLAAQIAGGRHRAMGGPA